MAVLNNNPLIKGFSGMLGNVIVFRKMRGKTIMANAPSRPQKQSEAQQANRSKFREAARWAQATLKDPEQKAYYQKKAKKLGLPNAYTAAITDYMRPAQVSQAARREDKVIYYVSKKDFRIRKAEVQVRDEAGALVEAKSADPEVNGDCIFKLPDYPTTYSLIWHVTDAVNRLSVLALK